MTDNEIIKALKALLELVLVEGCLQRAKTISNALDLINRQKAEIDENTTLRATLKTAKAEAYKEFAQKLESIIMWSPKNHISITAKDVRNILKELESEQPILNDVKCIDCEYLELELPYAVCSKAHKGIVQPNDSCGKGKLKELVGEDNGN